jgi:TonB-dependent SusC/RagA subfamily outer membrane receptor
MHRHSTGTPSRAALLTTALLLVSACGGGARGAAAGSDAQRPTPRDATADSAGRVARADSMAARHADRGGWASSSQSSTERDWQGRGATRVEELFQGRFAGVRVYEAPGGITVRIRGGSGSINGSNDPLYLLDGFPYTPGPDGLVSLNPGDIAKIEVLKDATSMAEYGVRGANGVVKITTKRGGKKQ